MADIAKAYVQIIPSAQGIKGSISNLLNGEASSAGDSGGSSYGSSFISKLKTVIAAAGIGKLLTDTIMKGADLEQSMGGVEALFGEEVGKQVEQRAAEAYKTMQVSANTYMEQATSFAAALLSATGGNAEEAAEVTNTAIQDMADNSARMGTSLESIQNAYQGFAKQNYTMLDNLKLGYGGTKTEMQRLLKNAQKISGVKYDISNLDDVYNAIHVIQEELHVTGTASQEANSTLSGSFASMKAAAENFMGALTLGQDVSGNLSDLVDTSVNFLVNNLIPAVINVVSELPTAVFDYISSHMDSFTESGVEMIKSISSGLAQGIPDFLNNALPMVLDFATNLRSNFGEIVDAGIDLLKNLVQGIVNSIPVLIEQVPQIIIEFCGLINDNMPKVLAEGVKMLGTLVMGIIDSIPILIENIPKIFEAFVATWGAFNWVSIGQTAITWIGNGISSLFSHIPSLLSNIGNTAVNFFKSINWLGLGQTVINLIKSGISGLLHLVVNALKSVGTSAFNAFKSISWGDLASGIINGIVSGLAAGVNKVVDAAKNLAQSALNGAKKLLGIHSPSKEFAWIGQMVDKGFANGLDEGAKEVTQSIKNITDSLLNPVESDILLNSGYNVASAELAGLNGNGANGYNQTININAPQELNPSEIARQTRNATRQMALALSRG